MPIEKYRIYKTIMQCEGDGVARFIAASPELIDISDSMANKREFHHTKGTLVKVSIRFRHGDKRYITSVKEWLISSTLKKTCSVDELLDYFANECVSFIKERCEDGEGAKLLVFFPKHSKEYKVFVSTSSAAGAAKQIAWVSEMSEKFGQYLVADGATSTSTAEVFAASRTAKEAKVAARAEKFSDSRLPDSELGKIRSFGNNGLRIRRGAWELMESMLRTVNEAETLPTSILMVGPSGWGKTSIPQAFADENKLKFLRIDCANIRDPEEWIGYREAKDGSTFFVKSEMVRVVEEGNAVVVFDEVNRIEPWMTNTLFSLLDHARRIVAHGEEIHVGPNVLFFASANIGGRFVGTFAIDAAFMNRFAAVLKVEPLPAQHEVQVLIERTGIEEEYATGVVKVANAIRKFDDQNNIGLDASLRTTLKICNLMKNSKIGTLSIIDLTIMNLVDDEAVVKQLIDIARPILSSEGLI